jgi:hypothetical protein
MAVDWQENPWSTSLIIVVLIIIIIIVLAIVYHCHCAPRHDHVAERSERSLVSLLASYTSTFHFHPEPLCASPSFGCLNNVRVLCSLSVNPLNLWNPNIRIRASTPPRETFFFCLMMARCSWNMLPRFENIFNLLINTCCVIDCNTLLHYNETLSWASSIHFIFS